MQRWQNFFFCFWLALEKITSHFCSTLNQVYPTYIRIWKYYMEQLELCRRASRSVQYEAARIVSGMCKRTSRSKLYKELFSWDSLHNMHRKQKHILVHKALIGYLQSFISKHFISQINTADDYHDLMHHLFQAHLYESSQCECGKEIEDNYHYFWICPNCALQRL